MTSKSIQSLHEIKTSKPGSIPGNIDYTVLHVGIGFEVGINYKRFPHYFK